jgi:Uma2 family endonuclease
MSATAHPKSLRLNVLDYEALPDDGQRYELIDGELHVSHSPTTKHQRVCLRLAVLLTNALADAGEVFISPYDVELDFETIVQPDLLFIPKAQANIVTDKRVVGVPALVIEILSPGTRRKDVRVKHGVYARFGVPQYWLVDPEIDRVEVFVLVDGGYEKRVEANSGESFDAPELPVPVRVDLRTLFRT